MHPLIAALALAAGVAVVSALSSTPDDTDVTWELFLKGHSELHA